MTASVWRRWLTSLFERILAWLHGRRETALCPGRYKARCLDLTQLATTPEGDQILRLMWGLNDLNSFPLFGMLLNDFEENNDHLWKYVEGIKGSLMRMRSARATELLETIVQPLVMNESNQRFPELDSIIKSDKRLKQLRIELRKLFCGPDRVDFDQHRKIRHNLVDHYNHDTKQPVILEAIDLTLAELNDNDGSPTTSWCLWGIDETNKHIARFIVADEVLTRAWRTTTLNVPYSKKGYKNSAEAQKAKDFTLGFMDILREFAGRLIDLYCQKHGIWIEGENVRDLFTPPEKRGVPIA